jgi:hypothetical protein
VDVREPLMISFADAGRRIQAVGIGGAGTLLRIGDELRLAGPPQFARDAEGWRVSSDGGLELSLAAWPGAAPLDDAGGPDEAPALASGTVGSQRVAGLAALRRDSDSAGDVGDGGDVALERMLAVLFDEGPMAVALTARRPTGAAGHGDERLDGVVFRGEPVEPLRIERPRLSSTYDSHGLLTHAGLELWESEDSDRPIRIGGEALARGELTRPDGTLTRVTFLAWHHEELHGLGSYAITLAA